MSDDTDIPTNPGGSTAPAAPFMNDKEYADLVVRTIRESVSNAMREIQDALTAHQQEEVGHLETIAARQEQMAADMGYLVDDARSIRTTVGQHDTRITRLENEISEIRSRLSEAEDILRTIKKTSTPAV